MATEESAHEIDALEADAGQAGKISKLVTLEQFIEIYKTYKDETVALYNVRADFTCYSVS